MKTSRKSYGLISILSAGALLATATVWAGPVGHIPNGGGGTKARSVRGGGGGNAIGSGANLERLGRAVNQSRGSNTPILDAVRGKHGSNTPVLDAIRNNGRGYYGGSDTPILDELRNRYYDNRGYYNGYHDHHRHDDDVADAYRDAAIANAVVNLVGIAVTAATQPRVQTVAVAPVACAPAPVAVAQPQGYYRTEKILVSEGYYEDVRVEVPTTRDQYGRTINGGYEIRKRRNPPVYEYRPVWVVE